MVGVVEILAGIVVLVSPGFGGRSSAPGWQGSSSACCWSAATATSRCAISGFCLALSRCSDSPVPIRLTRPRRDPRRLARPLPGRLAATWSGGSGTCLRGLLSGAPRFHDPAHERSTSNNPNPRRPPGQVEPAPPTRCASRWLNGGSDERVLFPGPATRRPSGPGKSRPALRVIGAKRLDPRGRHEPRAPRGQATRATATSSSSSICDLCLQARLSSNTQSCPAPARRFTAIG
jgi:hypothetical protein